MNPNRQPAGPVVEELLGDAIPRESGTRRVAKRVSRRPSAADHPTVRFPKVRPVEAVAAAPAPRTTSAEQRLARLGSLGRIPYVRWTLAQQKSAHLDSKAGYLLWLMDGSSNIESILDTASMPPNEALAMVYDLWSRGIIAFK